MALKKKNSGKAKEVVVAGKKKAPRALKKASKPASKKPKGKARCGSGRLHQSDVTDFQIYVTKELDYKDFAMEYTDEDGAVGVDDLTRKEIFALGDDTTWENAINCVETYYVLKTVRFAGWKSWKDKDWAKIETLLGKHDDVVDKMIADALGDEIEREGLDCGPDIFDSLGFFSAGCKRCLDWASPGVDHYLVGCLIEAFPELAYDERLSAKILSAFDDKEEWMSESRKNMWREIIKDHPPIEGVKKRGRLEGSDQDSYLVMQVDGKDVALDFGRWKQWDEKKWRSVEQLLSKCDEDIDHGIVQSMSFSEWDWTPFGANCDEYDGLEVMREFRTAACRRTPAWARVIDEGHLPHIAYDVPQLLDDAYARKKFSEGAVEKNGYFTEDESCLAVEIDDFELMIDRWSYVLACHPQLVKYFDSFEKIGGCECCLLLSRHPQFQEKISIAELADPSTPRWIATGEAGDFSYGWVRLLMKQPQFAEQFAAWNAISDEDWGNLVNEHPEFANRRAKCKEKKHGK